MYGKAYSTREFRTRRRARRFAGGLGVDRLVAFAAAVGVAVLLCVIVADSVSDIRRDIVAAID